ncbi:hypothetical protein Halha_0801 [Halobacteroides halobius DSM 5150]|uniref:Uncharacterized protein n=1 Tax=Halobacteroides halobius (strain ATCC 35273 / DSM 5150 / MD-1) TaxID=748449 RepID=L0K682_HALHC|nr:hypothetical protein [Halobacteroides halobius]AGB40772.1 hypothetical protein Halha_0801 [Halobacteroides halobius DSM 5150]
MLKSTRKVGTLVLMLALVVGLSSVALGYSYGTKEKDPLVKAYEEVVFSLNKSDQDWEEVKEETEKIEDKLEFLQKELTEINAASPFITDYIANIKSGIEAKDKEKIIHNFQLALAGNVERRLESAQKEISEYKTAKALVKKAKGFYEALELTIKANNPEGNEKAEEALRNCLSSLGNPGMFGFGAQEPNLEKYKANKEVVLNVLTEVVAK